MYGAVSPMEMNDFTTITKALSDENRVRALLALKNHELCLCQITELLGLATSTVSKHMSILKQAKLIQYRKEGRWMFYRLTDQNGLPVIQKTLDLVFNTLSKTNTFRQNEKRLKLILKLDPEMLCKKQNLKT